MQKKVTDSPVDKQNGTLANLSTILYKYLLIINFVYTKRERERESDIFSNNL